MRTIESPNCGRCTIHGRGEPTADGKFQATFTISEHQCEADVETKVSTGSLFGTKEDAEDAAIEAAKAWLEKFRSVND